MNKNIKLSFLLGIIAIFLIGFNIYYKNLEVINDEMVLNLYSTIYSVSEEINVSSFYKDSNVTFESLSDEQKIYTVFLKQDLDKKNLVWNSDSSEINIEDYKDTNFYTFYNESLTKNFWMELIIYDASEFELKYADVFGIDAKLPNKKYTNYKLCSYVEYLEPTKELLYYSNSCGGKYASQELTSYDSYKTSEDTIEIYDYYILVDNIYDIMNDYSVKENGQRYKHIFKKDTNNNYYWLSSSPE